MDKYSLFAASMIGVIALFIIFNSVPAITTDEIIGIADNIEKRDTGYVFDLIDENGETIRCFYKGEPTESTLYGVEGNYSDNGEMFFVNTLYEYE